MAHVREINDIDELVHYRLVWKNLLAQTRRPSFFQSLEWLEVFWKHFGQGRRLRVLVVYEGDEPLGIFPLVVQTERTRAGSVRVLTYPLDGWGSFFGPVGLNAAIFARLSGASQIIVLGAPDLRLDVAKAFSADNVINIENHTPDERINAVLDLTHGRGADVTGMARLGICLGAAFGADPARSTRSTARAIARAVIG